MWIRSQDLTELIKCQRIQADGTRIYTFSNASEDDDDSWIRLGTYATNERALEVLNDIETEIKDQNMYHNNVCYMPKE